MSSIEPSLQPSFKFPSRHNNANYAQGLLDQSAASQLLLVRPQRNTNVDLITSLESPLTVPKVNDTTVFDAPGKLPVATAIYVQPGLAEGMTGLAKQTNANVEITKVTSGNNALKRGNYIATEHVLGRQLTTEEIANRSITPNKRSSEDNANSQTHVNFSNAAFGTQVAAGHKNFQELQTKIKQADRDLLNKIASHYGLPGDVVSHVKTSLGFTGDSVLGSKTQYSDREVQDITNMFLHKFTTVYGMTPMEYMKTRRPEFKPPNAPQPASNIAGENRQQHSGAKAAREARYAADTAVGHVVTGPNGQAYKPDPMFYGRPETVQQQINDVNFVGPPDNNTGGKVLGPQAEYHVQTNVNPGYFVHNERMIRAEGEFEAPIDPNNVMADIPEAKYEGSGGMGAELLMDVDEKDPRVEYTEEGDEIQEGERVEPEDVEMKGNPDDDTRWRAHQLLQEKNRLTNEFERLILEYESHGGVSANLNLSADAIYDTPDDSDYASTRAATRARESIIHRLMRLRGEVHGVQHELDSLGIVTGRRRGKGVKSGGGLKSVRKSRTTRYHPFRAPPANFLPDTSSFSTKGALVSGKLMQNTGKNAVPISAQIQVANTHQLYETPLQQWVKNPNVTSELKPEPIPISQNFEGVRQRQKKVKIGGYIMDHHKLLSQNVLSVAHPSGKKVKGIPNSEVSDAMKDVIHKIVTGGKVSTTKLSAAEKLKLRELLHKSAANVSIGADVNVSPTQQLHLVLGEIEAGNDSAELKAQLRKLLPALKRSKALSAEQCADISHHYL